MRDVFIKEYCIDNISDNPEEIERELNDIRRDKADIHRRLCMIGIANPVLFQNTQRQAYSDVTVIDDIVDEIDSLLEDYQNLCIRENDLEMLIDTIYHNKDNVQFVTDEEEEE